MKFFRLEIVLFFWTILAVGLLACAPADESVRPRLGNLPSDSTASSQVAEPPQKALASQTQGSAQDEDAGPEPLPTFCVPWPAEYGGGTEGVMCVHPKQYPTPVYAKMEGDLSGVAERADRSREDRVARGETKAAQEETERIPVIIRPTTHSDAGTITAWLVDNDCWHTTTNAGTSEVYIESAVPAAKLGTLADLSAVRHIRQVTSGLTPH